MKQLSFFGIILTVLSLFAGCSRGPVRPKEMPELIPCEITILQDGRPLAGALTTLRKPDCRYTVTGVTDELGVAKIVTHALFEGAPEGEFTVMVEKMEDESSLLPPRPSDPAQIAAWEDEIRKFGLIHQYQTVDGQYASESSPLKITVAGNETKKEFDVGSAVRNKIGSYNAAEMLGIASEPSEPTP